MAISESLKEWEKTEAAYEDAMTNIYEESYYGSWLQHYYLRDFARLIRRELPHRARILDIGCGTGLLLAELRRHGFRNLYGIDLSPKMIEKARARKNFNGTLVVGSCYQLPFPEEHFDGIVISSVLHHLPTVSLALQEVNRCLRRYGLVFIREPLEDRYFTQDLEAAMGILGLMHRLYRTECTVIPKVPPVSEAHRAFKQEELRRDIETIFDILLWESRYPFSYFFERAKLRLIQRLAVLGDWVLKGLPGSQIYIIAAKKYFAPTSQLLSTYLEQTIKKMRPRFGWKIEVLLITMRAAIEIYSAALGLFRRLR